jgi:transcription termination/antitermination protein NusG
MLIMSFMNSEKEALDLPAIVTGNGEAYPKQWLAVYVRLYHEKKTSARLNTMGIDMFHYVDTGIRHFLTPQKFAKRFTGSPQHDRWSGDTVFM